MSLICSSGLAIAGVGVAVGVAPVVIGLLFVGFGAGAWDVAMNVEAAAVERQLKRSIMSRFHAAFSLGTVIGALLGAAMNALDISVTVNLLIIAALIAVAIPFSTRSLLPVAVETHEERRERGHPLTAWTEPRTLLIGLFVLTMAFAEGSANDWIGVASIDGYGATAALASLSYGIFVASMTIGRWYGMHILDRFGRVPVLRTSAAIALTGVLIVVYGPDLVTAMVGTALWGLGTALGFPTGMSAAADQPGLRAWKGERGRDHRVRGLPGRSSPRRIHRQSRRRPPSAYRHRRNAGRRPATRRRHPADRGRCEPRRARELTGPPAPPLPHR